MLKKIILFLALITGIYIPLANCAMVHLDTETLWNECDLAVVGTVLSINNIQKGGFFRIVEVEVDNYYLRQVDEPSVKIRIEGGEFGDMGIWVEDQPEFSVGEHVFVFLQIPEEIKGDYDYEVFGMYQGKWTVENNTAIREDQSFTLPEKVSSLRSQPQLINGYQIILAVAIVGISLIFLILYKLIIK